MSPTDKRRNRRGAERPANQKCVVWDRQRRKTRRELGQNFLKDERLARKMVKEAGVTGKDLVMEFGAGAGMLTRPLSERARKVVAVEYDPLWAARLKRSFAARNNVEVVAADALSVRLPEEPFRVLANVPFHLTTAILHRLLDDPTQPPDLVHLLVQKELAEKHVRASPTTLKTLTWSPWYRFEAAFELPAGAFDPSPGVGARLLVAARRKQPLVTPERRELFRTFVRGAFDGRGNTVGKVLSPVFTRKQIRRLAHDNGFFADSFPSRLTVHQWASVFEFMVRAVPRSRWPTTGPAARHAVERIGGRGEGIHL
jgi:23S rRNA (adenine-N6)-dimethyltransferase